MRPDPAALVADLGSSEPIAVDTETSGLGRWTGDWVMGVCLAARGWSTYVPVAHPKSDNWALADVRRLLLAVAEHPLVYHHQKFDVKWLRDLVPERSWDGDTWDTMVGSWLENENRPSHRLKDLASWLLDHDAKAEQRTVKALQAGWNLKALEDWHYYGEEDPAGEYARASGIRQPMGITRAVAHERALVDPRYGRREWWELTAEEMAPYGAKDADLTLGLYRYQLDLARQRRPDILQAMPREMRFQRSLYRMESAGVRVNAERAQLLAARAGRRQDRIRKAFLLHHGVDLGEMATGPRVRDLLYEQWGYPPRRTTPSGGWSTDKEALEDLAHDHRVGLLLEYRVLGKALSGYYRPLLERRDAEGRVHPTFNNERATRTGRLACSQPNLMTIPRPDSASALAELRSVFEPAPGLELWEFDLKQAELRFAAALARDEAMLAALNDPDRDLYREFADFAGCSRQAAKTTVLANNYNAGYAQLARILARGTGQPPDVSWARTLQFHFGRAYPKVRRALAYYEDAARRDGKLPLAPAGRFRHYRIAGLTQPYKDGFNAECQGGVGEMMKDLQMEAEPELDALGARAVLQVHDSLIAEVPPGEGPRVGKLLQRVVDDCNPFPQVRHFVEAKPWG